MRKRDAELFGEMATLKRVHDDDGKGCLVMGGLSAPCQLEGTSRKMPNARLCPVVLSKWLQSHCTYLSSGTSLCLLHCTVLRDGVFNLHA